MSTLETDISAEARIHKMLEEGKLSSEEAQQLLDALGAAGSAEETTNAAQESIRTAAQQQTKANVNVQVDTDSAAKENIKVELHLDNEDASKDDKVYDQDLNWISINMLFGDLDIRVQDDLDEPIILGDRGNFVQEGNVYTYKTFHTKKTEVSGDSISDFAKNVGNMMTTFLGKSGDIKVRIPQGFGVEISSKAGDVDVDGAAFLDAELLAGDLDARNIGGIRASMAAGDIDVSLRPTAGQNSIRLAAGDVDVELLPGSNVTVNSSVSMGDFRVRAPQNIEESLEVNKSLMGGDFTARVGTGEALLDINTSTGDIELRVASE